MTVDNTIACHETEEACKITEDLLQDVQQEIVNNQSTCDSYVTTSQDSQDNDNEEEENDNTQTNDVDIQQDSSIHDIQPDNTCTFGCVNEGTAAPSHSSGIQPEGDVDQTFDNDQSASSGGHIAQDDNDNEESED